jgi:uncharacterized protein YcfJ
VRRLALAALIFLGAGGLAQAQTGADWDRVLELEPGRRIEVRTSEGTGTKLRGTLRAVTANGVTLADQSGAERVYRRSEIVSVRLRRSDTAPVAGAVAGAAWGGLVAGISDGGGGQKAAAVAIVVGAGWLIGKGIQRGNWKIVYERAP